MNAQEAIEELDLYMRINTKQPSELEAIDEAISALEKQIPKEPSHTYEVGFPIWLLSFMQKVSGRR